MEPDLKWGKGYINALREALELSPPPSERRRIHRISLKSDVPTGMAA
jgi:hypothetical protein